MKKVRVSDVHTTLIKDNFITEDMCEDSDHYILVSSIFPQSLWDLLEEETKPNKKIA